MRPTASKDCATLSFPGHGKVVVLYEPASPPLRVAVAVAVSVARRGAVLVTVGRCPVACATSTSRESTPAACGVAEHRERWRRTQLLSLRRDEH